MKKGGESENIFGFQDSINLVLRWKFGPKMCVTRLIEKASVNFFFNKKFGCNFNILFDVMFFYLLSYSCVHFCKFVINKFLKGVMQLLEKSF